MSAIDFNIHCVGCGLNLRTCDSQGVCPRCGQAVAETLSLAVVDPANLVINGDLSCISCGYNLRTLHTSSLCPECGKPIAPTLSPDPLRRAGRDWLNSMRRGLNLLTVIALVLALQSAMSCVAYTFFTFSTPRLGWSIYLALQICYLMWCIGACWVTRAEPGRDGWLGSGNLRTWARVMAIAMVICHLASHLHMVVWSWWSTGQLSLLPSVGSMPGMGQMLARAAQSAATAAVSVASWMLLFAYLRQLVRRAGRRPGLLTLMIYLLGLHGIIQVIQYGPLYFVLMNASYGYPYWLRSLGLQPYTIWQFVFFFQSFLFAAILIPAAVGFLRCSKMFKAAAEGRSDRSCMRNGTLPQELK